MNRSQPQQAQIIRSYHLRGKGGPAYTATKACEIARAGHLYFRICLVVDCDEALRLIHKGQDRIQVQQRRVEANGQILTRRQDLLHSSRVKCRHAKTLLRPESQGMRSSESTFEHARTQRECYLDAPLRWILCHLERDLHSERASFTGMKYDLIKQMLSFSHHIETALCASDRTEQQALSGECAQHRCAAGPTCTLQLSPGLNIPLSGSTVNASVGFGAPPSTSWA